MAAALAKPDGVATDRTPGFDVARALAILGMILVNFKAMAGPAHADPEWLLWLVERLEGRAAVLFVLLAGVGVTLRAKKPIPPASGYLDGEQRALIKRAAILFLIGLANVHLWEWDILHFYGAYLVLAAFLIRRRDDTLVFWMIAFTAISAGLHTVFTYEADVDLWSLLGLPFKLLFGGLHPVFPWMSFLVLGMWLGRQDLRDPMNRRTIMVSAAIVALMAEAIDSISRASALLDPSVAWWLSSWPRPPTPTFVVAAAATAVAALCLCIELTERRRSSRIVLALTATGQLSFTLYVAHTAGILIPLEHGALEEGALWSVILYGLLFYAVSVAAAVW